MFRNITFILLLLLLISCRRNDMATNFGPYYCNKNCYVTFDPTGFKSHPLITVFLKYSKKSYYIGFSIGNQIDSSDSVYSNQYRILNASEYYFNGGKMLASGNTVLENGENECVYRASNRADFTGGYHGDEKISSIFFYIDNQVISFKNKLTLIPCEEFSYIQISTMHESPRLISNIVTPNRNHPIEAFHSKLTIFKNGGYETYNTLEWKKEIDIQLWYHGIASIGKICGTKILDKKDSVLYSCIGSNKFYRNYKVGEKEVFYKNDSAGISAWVESTLIAPYNLDTTCQLMVWDTPVYSKYYRIFRPNKITNIGEIWKSRMTVKFLKENL